MPFNMHTASFCPALPSLFLFDAGIFTGMYWACSVGALGALCSDEVGGNNTCWQMRKTPLDRGEERIKHDG